MVFMTVFSSRADSSVEPTANVATGKAAVEGEEAGSLNLGEERAHHLS